MVRELGGAVFSEPPGPDEELARGPVRRVGSAMAFHERGKIWHRIDNRVVLSHAAPQVEISLKGLPMRVHRARIDDQGADIMLCLTPTAPSGLMLNDEEL
ncbi:hypothetical protein AWB74_08624 [Caballeronia arvi]|uniref:Uncharacterized protein n=1 Tax=Caballeronia arvi TaxID=1777135 RepID=A0A158L5K9_9BURK|nr:hypothetical protein AWB74_08624 [Caballeronia arvi]